MCYSKRNKLTAIKVKLNEINKCTNKKDHNKKSYIFDLIYLRKISMVFSKEKT